LVSIIAEGDRCCTPKLPIPPRFETVEVNLPEDSPPPKSP